MVDGSAPRNDAGGQGAPSWEDIRQGAMTATELCAAAVISMALRGPRDTRGAAVASQAVTALRDLTAAIREWRFDEAVVEAERVRAAAEALTAAGIPPPRPHPDLRIVS